MRLVALARVSRLALAIVWAVSSPFQIGASRLMLAAVTDQRGRSVVDVGADDFVVQEAGASREILSVRVADYPIVVLIDTNAPARDDFPLMQKAAAHFIQRLGNERPVIAGVFGDAPKLLASFDDDRKTVLERLNGIEPDGARGSSRASNLLKGAALAAETLHATGSLFSAVVILSSSTDSDDGESAERAIAAIVDSGAIVHVIANRSIASPPLGAIRTIVNQTRGEYTPIYAAASFQAALDRLADRLSSEMLIEYLVPPGSKPVDAKVGIRVPGARVRGLGVAPK
jgi:von Willebrand factor type A domain-containing protein